MAKLKRSPDAKGGNGGADPNDSATIDEVDNGASQGNMASRIRPGPRPMRLMKDSKNSESVDRSNQKDNKKLPRETPQQPQDVDSSPQPRRTVNEQGLRLTFSPDDRDQLDLTPVKHHKATKPQRDSVEVMAEITKSKQVPKHTVKSAYVIDKRDEPRNTEDRR